MKTKENNIQKAILFFLILISILLIILIMQRSDIIKIGKSSNKKQLNNGELVLSEDGEVAQTVNASNWDTSKVTATKDADGKEVPVPKGYVGSSVAGENKISEGYVIYEGTATVNSSNVASARTSRNQWVWIPVPDPNRIYEEVNGVKRAKLYAYTASGRVPYPNNNYEPAILPEWDNSTNLSNAGLTGMTPDKLYQELQQEFNSTIESIKKYGGFYVGRYETGNLSQTVPVVKKMNTDITNQSWYTCYSKMGYLAANQNVKTNMIWGCLWDEMLQWMLEMVKRWPADYVTAGFWWGNTEDSEFSYVNSNGQTVTKTAYQKVKIPTGSVEHFVSTNIYDICGNAWEATLEAMNPIRISRGGAYEQRGDFYSAGARCTLVSNVSYTNVGVRAYLYIK